MGIKKLLEKIDKMELDNKIILFILFVIGILGGVAYLAALLVPSFQPFIDNSILYQAVGYLMAFGIGILVILIVVITIKMAIKNNKLEEKSVIDDKKIQELEAELRRLQKDG